jgi:hypothetical protein
MNRFDEKTETGTAGRGDALSRSYFLFSHFWLPTVQEVLQADWQEVWHSPQPRVSRFFLRVPSAIVLMCFILICSFIFIILSAIDSDDPAQGGETDGQSGSYGNRTDAGNCFAGDDTGKKSDRERYRAGHGAELDPLASGKNSADETAGERPERRRRVREHGRPDDRKRKPEYHSGEKQHQQDAHGKPRQNALQRYLQSGRGKQPRIISVHTVHLRNIFIPDADKL